jgi:hypothetical protein
MQTPLCNGPAFFTLSIMLLAIMGLLVTLSINDTEHIMTLSITVLSPIMLNAVMLSVIMLSVMFFMMC